MSFAYYLPQPVLTASWPVAPAALFVDEEYNLKAREILSLNPSLDIQIDSEGRLTFELVGGGPGGGGAWGTITGTLSDQTDLQAALDASLTQGEADALYETVGTAAAAVAAHEGAADPHPGYLTAAEGAAAYQPLDADLTTIAANITAAGHALLDDASAAVQRTTLGLGSVDNTSDASKPVSTATQTALNLKQDTDAELTALAGLTSAADRLPYFTGSGTAALATFTGAARNLLDDADAATMLTTLGAQPLDADLTALAGLNATAGLVEQTGAAAFTKRLIGVTNATDIPTRGDADTRFAAASHGIHITDGDKGDITIGASGTTFTVDAAAITLAKMANLAQDQFIGRVTASTGVPETATITAAARTVLDDTTTANMLTTLGAQGTAAKDAANGYPGLSASSLINPAQLGSGASITTKFLRGDSTWQALAGGGDLLSTNNLSDVSSAATALTNLGGVGSASPTFTGTVTLPGSTVIGAGSASANSWPKLTAGTVLTTPEAGALELDSNCLYGTTDAGNRGVVPIEHIIRADATRTFTSNTTQQAIFTTPANGTLTLETGVYFFEALVAMTAMSATSGNGKFSLIGAGTATLGALLWHVTGQDAAAEAAAAAQGGSYHVIATQTAVDIVTAATGTAVVFEVHGTFEVTAAGTIIPSFALTTASAAVVSIGSFFKCSRKGSTTMTSVGQWS